MIFTKKQYKAVLSITGLILAVLFLRQTDLFISISGYSYDLMGRWSVTKANEDSRVTLVSVPAEKPMPSQQWVLMIQQILQHKPKALIVNLNTSLSENFQWLVELKNETRLYFLVYLQADDEQVDQYQIPILKQKLEQTGLKVLLTAFPVSESGTYRHQWYELPVKQEGNPLFSYEFLVTGQQENMTDSNNDTRYLVNFLSGSNSIAKISAQRVLSGQLLPELVEDKYILLGTEQNIVQYGLITPLGKHTNKLSLLEFQGYALDSVVQKKWITEPGNGILVFLLLVQIIASLLFYQWNRRYIGLLISYSLVTLYILIAWYLLHFEQVRFPLLELVVVQFVLHIVVQRFQAMRNEEELQTTLLAISAKTQERVIPVSFYQSEDPWSQIVVLVNQTLNLNRLIFLERIPGDHRVREIKSFNCSIDDIHEMRRDYERAPYSIAIEAKAPIKINTEQRAYLKNSSDDEEQYLVPLIFGNEILGFWAFGITVEHLAHTSSFTQHISDYARQISELLYYRHRFQDEQQSKTWLQRYLRVSTQQSTQQLLNETIEVLNHRLDSLESVFHGISSSTILYDLFGRVVQMNTRMEKFIYDHQIPAYEMTALDFIRHTTDIEVEKVRQIIEQIIIEQRQFTLPLVAEDEGEHFYVLIAKPLKAAMEDEFSDVLESTPFQVLGVLIELNDLSEMKENIAIKEKINEFMICQLKNDLNSMIQSLDGLSDGVMSEGKRSEIRLHLLKKLENTSRMINEFDKYLHNDNNMLAFDMYPVEVNHILKQVINVLVRDGIRDNIKIEPILTPVMTLVIAEINALKSMMILMFKLLIDDAMSNSLISIEVEDDKNNVYIKMSNIGFGMPDDEFREYLLSDSAYISKDFIKLRNYMQTIKKWGGEITAHSNVGEGIRFTIILSKVL